VNAADSGAPPRRRRGRRIAVSSLLVVGTLLATVFGFGLWANRQALNTDNWVDTSNELLEDEEVRVALGNFLVDRLYQSENMQARLETVLPPSLAKLAAPAAAGLKELARRNAPRLLGTAAALNAWEVANRKAHETLLKIVQGDVANRDVSLDLESLLRQVAEGTGLPPDAVNRLPPELAQLQIAGPDQLETAQNLLDLFETLVWVLLVLTLAAFIGAVFLSPDRRRTILSVGGCLIVTGIALLALRGIAGRAVVDALADAPNAGPAADDVWSISTSLLVDVAEGALLLGAFIVSGAWLGGPGRRATTVRRYSAPTLREHPGVVRAGLGVAILLLVVWGPVPWTQRFIPIIIFTIGAFLWLEWIRNRALEEFPEASAPGAEPAPGHSGSTP
jgi:hypothetical protein